MGNRLRDAGRTIEDYKAMIQELENKIDKAGSII